MRRKRNARNTSRLDSAMDQAVNRKKRGPESFFFNYNTMEAILLSCAILVCLCGVMFTSGQLDQPENEWQQIIVTIFLTSIFFGSMIYIGTVFASELQIKLPTFLIALFADAKTAREKLAEAGGRDDGYGDVELASNPMMKSAEEEARLKKVRAEAEVHKRAAQEHAAKAADMADQQGAMLAKMRSLKKQAASGPGKVRRRGKKKKTKKTEEYAQERIRGSSLHGGIDESSSEEPRTKTTPKKKKMKLKKGRMAAGKSPSKKSLFANVVESEAADISLDIFETEQASAISNPMNVIDDTETKQDTLPEVFTDKRSGRRYSVNAASGLSEWLEDSENPNLASF
jgi:hypothetical protein